MSAHIKISLAAKRLTLCVNFSADDILIFFSYFSLEQNLIETICMKCEILFSGAWGGGGRGEGERGRGMSSFCRLLNLPREW